MSVSQMTVGEVISTVRDLVAIGFLTVLGWKARGIFQIAKESVQEVRDFMKRMDKFANEAVNNHLLHIEKNLDILASRKTAGRDPLLEESNEERST